VIANEFADEYYGTSVPIAIDSTALHLMAMNIPIPPASDAERNAWIEEFKAAARRPLAVRLRYSFVKTYKPVLDDATYRSFDSMAEYRQWCETSLPSWLGYGRG
jgi:hypothetical protein